MKTNALTFTVPPSKGASRSDGGCSSRQTLTPKPYTLDPTHD